MTGHRITFYGSIEERLRLWLTGCPQGHERGALVLFRRYRSRVEGLPDSIRFVAIDVIALDGDWIIESSSTHLHINLRNLPPIYHRCEVEGLQLGFAHSHPPGSLFFSPTDDQNEQNILRGYAGCNGLDVDLVALVLSDNRWIGLVRSASTPQKSEPVRHVTVLGDAISVHLGDTPDETPEVLARQETAFGKPFNRKLQSLRVAVVGLGGTGSPLATLLARSGIGELVLIDGDDLEETNLNRVRGYRKADVGEPKARSLAAYIKSLGLPSVAAPISEYMDRSPAAIDAIATADLVFGCTDDVAGRDLLTQAAYYYCLPYLDIGLTGAIRADEDGAPYLYDHRGRVSVMLPEAGSCLRCQGVVTENKLAYERALKDRPELAELDPETLRREYYLTGGNESAPGVGAFTNSVADLAMATFMDLIRPYRRLPTDFRADNLWYDFVHLTLYSNMPAIDPDCFCCGANGLLCAPERGYRLGMPALGRTPD